MLINQYTNDAELRNFPDLDEKIKKHYDLLFHTAADQDITLRTPRHLLEAGTKIGFRDIFYYICWLYDNDPQSVIDVGCGENLFKDWFPNITGFDPNKSVFTRADYIDIFDKDFSKAHKEQFDCGMALNSLHFIRWDKIADQIELAMNIIKTDGRFLFTFNFDQIDLNSPKKFASAGIETKIAYLDTILGAVKHEVVVLDYPILRGITEQNMAPYNNINGTVRFVLEKR